MQRECHSDTSHLWSICFPLCKALSAFSSILPKLLCCRSYYQWHWKSYRPDEHIFIWINTDIFLWGSWTKLKISHTEILICKIRRYKSRLGYCKLFKVKNIPDPFFPPPLHHLVIFCLISNGTIEMSCPPAEELYVNTHKQWLWGEPFLKCHSFPGHLGETISSHKSRMCARAGERMTWHFWGLFKLLKISRLKELDC